MKGGHVRGKGILIAAAALLAIAAPAADAKKDGRGKSSKPGKLRTATATVNTTTQGEIVSVVATCPGKTKVVGGGFVLGILDEGFGNGPDQNNVLESRREGEKAWRVTAKRDDRQFSGGGPGANPLPVTAEAYCRRRPGKITEVATTEVWNYPGGPATFSPSAACGLGKAAVGGGFALVSSNLFAAHTHFLTMSRPLGDVGWSTVSNSAGGGGPSAASYVYCQKLKKPLRQTSASAAMPPGSNGTAIAAVDTPACPGKRTTLGGGLELPPFTAGQGIPLPVESRRSGESWRVSTAKQLGTPAGGTFTAFALCG
jgi:hypothetical protein